MPRTAIPTARRNAPTATGHTSCQTEYVNFPPPLLATEIGYAVMTPSATEMRYAGSRQPDLSLSGIVA